jgi:hypothetical protein
MTTMGDSRRNESMTAAAETPQAQAPAAMQPPQQPIGLVHRGRLVLPATPAVAASGEALWYVAKALASGGHATQAEAESYAQVWDAKVRDGLTYALPVEARLLPATRLYARLAKA